MCVSNNVILALNTLEFIILYIFQLLKITQLFIYKFKKKVNHLYKPLFFRFIILTYVYYDNLKKNKIIRDLGANYFT